MRALISDSGVPMKPDEAITAVTMLVVGKAVYHVGLEQSPSFHLTFDAIFRDDNDVGTLYGVAHDAVSDALRGVEAPAKEDLLRARQAGDKALRGRLRGVVLQAALRPRR